MPNILSIIKRPQRGLVKIVDYGMFTPKYFENSESFLKMFLMCTIQLM